MSIILDALKKAETERHLGKIPGLHTPASTDSGLIAQRNFRSGRLVWSGVFGLALLAIGTAFWWTATNDEVGVSRIRLMPAPSPASTLSLPAPVPVTVARSADIPVPPPIAPPPAAIVVPKAIPMQTPVPAIVAKPSQAVATSPPQKSVPPATSAERVIAMSDLSPSMQRELPPLAIGGSMYSDNAAERMLLIDKRLFHEGDEVAPGLLLEKLMPKEAILRFRGVRFRINF